MNILRQIYNSFSRNALTLRCCHYVYSPQLADTVTVNVWLPENYRDGGDSLNVVYMHDGQNHPGAPLCL